MAAIGETNRLACSRARGTNMRINRPGYGSSLRKQETLYSYDRRKQEGILIPYWPTTGNPWSSNSLMDISVLRYVV